MDNICNKVGYGRVSTEDQHTDNQKKMLLEAGVVEDCIFLDKGVSGKIRAEDRPGFKRMEEYIKAHPGEVQYLYVYEISRLGRTTLDTLNTIERLEKGMGVKVWSLSPNESFMTTEDGACRELLLMLMSWVARRELDNLVDRTRRGLDRARAEGKILGRPRQEITPEQARAVKKMKEEGKNWEDIAKELNIPPTRLYRWRKRRGGVTAKPRKNQPQKATGGG